VKDRPGLRPAAACAYNVAYKLQPSRFQNLGLATLKHRATGGWTRASACGCLCLTLLSKLQLSSLQNLGLATLKHHATEGRARPLACGLRLPGLTGKKLAPNCSLQASKTLASPNGNTMELKGGLGLRPAAARAWRFSLNRQVNFFQ